MLNKIKRFMNSDHSVFFIQRHRTSSGTRYIQLLVAKNNNITDITMMVATALGSQYNEKHEGVQVKGSGHCAGDHIICHLSQELYGDPSFLKARKL